MQELSLSQECRRGDRSRVVMQSYTGFNSMDHLGADCGVMDICADFDACQDGDNVEGEGVTHCIYHEKSITVIRTGEMAATNEQIWDEFRDSFPRQVH